MFKMSTVGRYTSLQSLAASINNFCGKADQISCSVSFNSGLLSTALTQWRHRLLTRVDKV